jgi:hypothetical protein
MRTMSPVGPELKKLEKAPNVCRRGQTGLVSRGPRPPILDPKRSSGFGCTSKREAIRRPRDESVV